MIHNVRPDICLLKLSLSFSNHDSFNCLTPQVDTGDEILQILNVIVTDRRVKTINGSVALLGIV